MNKPWKRLLSVLLALQLLLASGCGAVETTPAPEAEAPVQTVEAVEAEQTEQTEAEPAVREQPEWAKDAVIYEVNIRQYTPEGTFSAFQAHLPRLREMGVNVLWLMPIHPISELNRSGELGSYYSVADYRAVNPEYGSEEDFRALVDTAHELGFHVLLDWVANHTGWDNPWVTEHPDWYTQDESGAIISPANMGWPDVADLNFDNGEMRQAMIDSMRYWVEAYDIDGFRCDHAAGVPVDFWEEARRQLDEVKPLLLLAETDGVKELLQYAFDFDYGWQMWDTLCAIAVGGNNANAVRYYLPSNYPEGRYKLWFLDNHDKNSYEGTIADHFGPESLPLMFALIYTLPGAPLVYSGDEVGLNHALAFTSRDPIDWDSTGISYAEELTALAALRRNHPALFTGSFGGEAVFLETGSKHVLAFTREREGETLKLLFHMSRKEHEADLSQWLTGEETVLMHGVGNELLRLEEYPIAEDGLASAATLAPWEFYIVKE